MVTDIAERVRKVIVMHHLVAAETTITEDAKFIDDLGADSLDVVELVISFEEEFNILIPDYVTEKLVTVGDAVSFITEARRATRPFSGPWNHFSIGGKVGQRKGPETD